MEETEIMKISIIGGADNGVDIRVDMDNRYYELIAAAICDSARANPEFMRCYTAEVERRIKELN